jgi:hypothetical protein
MDQISVYRKRSYFETIAREGNYKLVREISTGFVGPIARHNYRHWKGKQYTRTDRRII